MGNSLHSSFLIFAVLVHQERILNQTKIHQKANESSRNSQSHAMMNEFSASTKSGVRPWLCNLTPWCCNLRADDLLRPIFADPVKYLRRMKFEVRIIENANFSTKALKLKTRGSANNQSQ